MQRESVTGLVLAGGRGSRMGGADKGWLLLDGEPLITRALRQLRPQVGQLLVSANRHLDAYRALGVPVVSDASPPDGGAPNRPFNGPFDGPLAGVLAGLQACSTPWLACVPCDAPWFPHDLVTRLHQAAQTARAPAAFAVSIGPAGRRPEPAFCVVHTGLCATLAEALARGERRMGAWLASCGAAEVSFTHIQETPAGARPAFANLNTPQDLSQAQRPK